MRDGPGGPVARRGGHSRTRMRSDGPAGRRPHFWLSDTENGDVGGIDNLPAALTINGVTKLPTVRYRGGDADGTDWDAWTYGETLTAAGSGGSFDQGTPWFGDSDYAVDPAGTRYWKASGNDLADVTTEDIVVEFVLKFDDTAIQYIFNKWSNPNGWLIYRNSANSLAFAIADGTAGQYNLGSSFVDGDYYHVLVVMDRSGSVQPYVNNVAGIPGDCSARSGSLTVASPLAIGGTAAGASLTTSHLLYFALYMHAGWLDTHLQPAVATERFQRLGGLYPKRALGTKAWTSFTRATSAVSDKVERGAEVLPSTDPTTGWWETRADATRHTGEIAHPEGVPVYNLNEDDTADNTHYMVEGGIAVTDGKEYEVSVDIKSANRAWLRLYVNDGGLGYLDGDSIGSFYGSAAGTLGTAVGGPLARGIESLGDDWYRCRFRFRTIGTGNITFIPMVGEADNDITFDGLDQVSLYIANPSVKLWERKLYSVGSGLPRQCVRPALTTGKDFRGNLTEPAVTNLVTYSQELDSWASKGQLTVPSEAEAGAPDGTSTLNILHEDNTAASIHYVTSTFAGAGSTAYLYSIWLKAINRSWALIQFFSTTDLTGNCYFDLVNGVAGTATAIDAYGIEDWGNGLFRCWIRDTRATAETQYYYVYPADDDASNSFDGLDQDSLYAWGAMVEADVDYPSSYVPTSGATATRNADVPLFKGDDGNLGGVGSYGRGTMEFDMLLPNKAIASDTTYPMYLSDGGAVADRIFPYLAAGDSFDVHTRGSGGNNGTVAGSTDVVDGDPHTLRMTWKTNELRNYVDGTEEGTADTDCAMPDDLDRINLGCAAAGTSQLNGLWRNLRIWPTPHTHE